MKKYKYQDESRTYGFKSDKKDEEYHEDILHLAKKGLEQLKKEIEVIPASDLYIAIERYEKYSDAIIYLEEMEEGKDGK